MTALPRRGSHGRKKKKAVLARESRRIATRRKPHMEGRWVLLRQHLRRPATQERMGEAPVHVSVPHMRGAAYGRPRARVDFPARR